ncbi:MAG TPA: hypothetical protein VGC16_02395 [Rhizomicrobium sp.]
MRFGFLLAALMLSAATVPAVAQSACIEPVAPAPVDGGTVTADQLRTANADVRNFISQSNDYQACLASELEAAKAGGQPVDPAQEADTRARIAASQKAQERVGMAINAAVSKYKMAHVN